MEPDPHACRAESLDLVEKSSHVKGGRRITGQGQRDMDLIAGRIGKSGGIDEDDEEEEES